MKRSKVLWGLLALNLFLAIVLAVKLGVAEKPAHANMNALAAGDYIMAPARVQGFNNGVVFVLDTNNGVLSAFSYDHNNKQLATMDPIPLQRVFEGGGGARNPRARP